VDVDIVVGLGIHVHIDVDVHRLALIQLSESQLAEQSGFGTFQLSRLDIELHLGDAADAGSGAVHTVALIDAGLVGMECHGQALGLIVDLSDGFIDYSLEEGVVVAVGQGLADGAEVVGTIALHGVVQMLTGIGEGGEIGTVAIVELQGAGIVLGLTLRVGDGSLGSGMGIGLQLVHLLHSKAFAAVDADRVVSTTVVHLGTQRFSNEADGDVGSAIFDDRGGIHLNCSGLAVGDYRQLGTADLDFYRGAILFDDCGLIGAVPADISTQRLGYEADGDHGAAVLIHVGLAIGEVNEFTVDPNVRTGLVGDACGTGTGYHQSGHCQNQAQDSCEIFLHLGYLHIYFSLGSMVFCKPNKYHRSQKKAREIIKLTNRRS